MATKTRGPVGRRNRSSVHGWDVGLTHVPRVRGEERSSGGMQPTREACRRAGRRWALPFSAAAHFAASFRDGAAPRWEGVLTFVPWVVTPCRLRSDRDDRLGRRHALPRLAQRSPGGLPVYDMVLTEHRVVEAEVDTQFATARDFDFLTVRSPLVTAMMAARALPSVGGVRSGTTSCFSIA